MLLDATAAERIKKRRALIALTPLIDVVFILLLFFMLASSFLDWHTIKLSTPTTQGLVKQSSGGAVLIRVGANGVLDLNGQPVQLNQIAAGLRRFLDANADQRILIRPADGVPLQPVVAILDEVKEAGAHNVSLTR